MWLLTVKYTLKGCFVRQNSFQSELKDPVVISFGFIFIYKSNLMIRLQKIALGSFSDHIKYYIVNIKGVLLGLSKFLTTESLFKMMKNALHFTLKSFFVFKLFKFLPCLFGCVEIQLDQKYKIDFEIYDVLTWETNNCNTNIA